MNVDIGFRRAVAEIAPSVRQLSTRDLQAFGVALLAELARREGCDMAAQWAEDQAVRLRSLDAVTA